MPPDLNSQEILKFGIVALAEQLQEAEQVPCCRHIGCQLLSSIAPLANSQVHMTTQPGEQYELREPNALASTQHHFSQVYQNKPFKPSLPIADI